MKPSLTRYYCAAILTAAAAATPVAARAGEWSQEISHHPMEHYLNPDGSFMRFKGTIESPNWSGYAVTAGAPYTSASATWQVPKVTYDGGAAPYGYEYVLNWVGIGGYGDQTLIQLGTESVVSTSGATSFYTWYELYPAVSMGISLAVNPGDTVTAALQCIAACSPGQTQTWQLSLSDETAKSSWTQNFQYQSSMASAEWVTEEPYYNPPGYLPLADYGQAIYGPVAANGANPNLSLSANGIIGSDPYGETSNPSAPVGGDAFSTCWGAKGASLTPCTAGSIASDDPPPPPPPPPPAPPPPPPPPPAPSNVSVTLTATPSTTTMPGMGVKLTWTSKNATSCTGNGFTVGNNGAWVTGPFAWALVFPRVTTSYSITCSGSEGSATSMTTVTVQ